jgi:sn-glycerol 3-phosphate transport system permease protein
MKEQKTGSSLFTRIEPYLYLIPALVLFGLFVFYPFVKTIVYSFAITTPLGEIAHFVGIQNYIDIFTSKDFISTLLISFRYSVMVVAFCMLLGFVLAIISNEKFPGRSIFRTFYAMPLAISAAAAAAMFTFILHPTLGTLNYILHTEIKWLTSPKYALNSITMVTVWMRVGINYIFLLAALQSVPKDLYESASLEGAGFFQKHWFITIPCISPTLFFLLIINVISSLQQFAQVKMMTDGGPSKSTNVIVYEIYQEAFMNGRFGVACTESVVLFIILFILTSLQFKLEKKVTY